MTDCISLASFVLAVFIFGVSVGKFVEKIKRFISEKEDGKHRNTHKNDRR